jgi:hypothetical protein
VVFLESIISLSWTFLEIIPKNNYLISFLISTSFFPNNDLHLYNYQTPFSYRPTWIRKKKLSCLFTSIKFILIQIEFYIDITNDEYFIWLKTIFKQHKKTKNKKVNRHCSAQQRGAKIWLNTYTTTLFQVSSLFTKS